MEKMYRRYSEYNCVDATTVYPITSIELLPFLEPSVLRDRFHSWEGWPLKLIYSISYPTYMIWKWIRSGYCFEPLEIMKWTIVQYWTQIPFHALSFTLSWWCEWILNKLTIYHYILGKANTGSCRALNLLGIYINITKMMFSFILLLTLLRDMNVFTDVRSADVANLNR